MHRLAQSVLHYIRKHDLLRPGDSVGVAVSGGADSVALLRLMLELRTELGIVLSVAHFNHKLRGAESDADEQFVHELAAQHDVPFVTESGGVKGHAAKKKISTEMAARELRYAFFNRMMTSGQLDKIATAHTLDDQAETVLLKLARGAGTRGLAGIYPKISLQPPALIPLTAIVRPLLAARRPELEQHLSKLGQSWLEDPSNRDLQHTRNRIRHQILPRIEELVNPVIRETLAEAAEIARAEDECWASQAASLMQQAWKMQQDGGALDNNLLREQPLAVRRRLVRAAAESCGLNLEFQHVEEILALGREGSQIVLPDGWTAMLHRGAIHIHRKRQPTESYEYPLVVPALVIVKEAQVAIETAMVKDGRTAVLLNAALVNNGLLVRNWRAGDRFWPTHRKEPKKIKDLLQDRHITGDEKKRWPVIASGDEIVWVRGLGVRGDLQAKNGEGVLISERPLEEK